MKYSQAPREDELIIKVENDGIWFYAEAQTPYSATNLPKHCFRFKASQEIFWKIKLIAYDEGNNYQIVEVIDYFEEDHVATWVQNKPQKKVNKYIFKKLDWSQFEKQINSYIRNKDLIALVSNMDTDQVSHNPSWGNAGVTRTPSQSFLVHKQIAPKIINNTFEIPFEKATFNNGNVSATVVHDLESFDIIIENDFLKSQFDYIKLWFRKKFNSPSFKVIVKGSILNGVFTQESVFSEDISKINEEFIEQCRIYQVEEFLKKSNEEFKPLTSISEIFNKPETAPIFRQETLNELEVINQILEIKKVRNEYQLAFLSGHNKVAAGKIMVSNSPTLGFVFCFQEENKTSFVWELLESNATYLWVFSKSNMAFSIMVETVQKEMSKIYKQGRVNYLNREANDEPFKFDRIFHTKANEPEDVKKQGLELWIARFNKFVF